MKKLVVVLCLAFVAVVTALFFVTFDSPELGRAVLERASATTGLQMTAERFRLNVIRGLEVGGVEVKGKLADGSEISARLERLVLEHRLLPLLSRKISVTRIILDSPEVALVEASPGAGSPKAAPKTARRSKDVPAAATDRDRADVATPASGGLSLEVEEIKLVNAKLETRAPRASKPSTTLEGLDLTLRRLVFNPSSVAPLAALSAEGRLSFNEATFSTTRVSRLEGEFTMAEGTLRIPKTTFATEQGRFEGELVVELNATPFRYTMKLAGDPLDMNATLGAGAGGGLGPGRLDLAAQGVGSETKTVKAQGTLKLAAGKLPASPVLTGVEKALGKTTLVGAPYKPTEARFRLDKNRLTLEPFKLETDQVALSLEGWADLQGPLALQLVVRAPRASVDIKEIRPEILDTLTDDKGWVAIPFKVAGTSEKPAVAPDASALAAQARQGTERLVKAKATEELKGFLGKKLR